MQLRYLLIVGVCFFGAYQTLQTREVTYGPGVVAPTEPTQDAPYSTSPITHKSYQLQPLHRFVIEARVLGAEHYRLDREADLAPVDLAMGWGRMSDDRVLDKIEIKQSGRFYFWRTPQFPIPREEIETHSGNMHMIPSNEYLESQLKKLRKGQVVKISGLLVEAKAKDGWHWRSSTTRQDTGNGACELIYVKTLQVVKE